MRAGHEPRAGAARLRTRDRGARLSGGLGVPAGHRGEILGGDAHRADSGDAVGVRLLAGHPLLPRRLVIDEEGSHAAMRPAREREHPAELVPVRADARLRDRVGDVDAGVAKGARVAHEVVGLEAIVHQPAPTLQRGPPPMVGIVAVEPDQLEVRAVGEGDERVVGPHRVPPARHHGEAELPVGPRGGLEILHRDDEMIDAGDHARAPGRKAGATSVRKRLSCPA